MKRVIRFLARISGVEKEIKKERDDYHHYFISTAAYWFVGGNGQQYRIPVGNALNYLATGLREDVPLSADRLRKFIDEHKYTRFEKKIFVG